MKTEQIKKRHIAAALFVALLMCVEPADAASVKIRPAGATTTQTIEDVAHTAEMFCLLEPAMQSAKADGDEYTVEFLRKLVNAHTDHLYVTYGQAKTIEVIKAADYHLKAKAKHRDGKVRGASCEMWKQYLLAKMKVAS